MLSNKKTPEISQLQRFLNMTVKASAGSADLLTAPARPQTRLLFNLGDMYALQTTIRRPSASC